jgi:hypothetical protein
MISSSPIADNAIADETGSVDYLPVSRLTSGGMFQAPSVVPTLLFAWNWDNGSAITWDDGSVMENT